MSSKGNAVILHIYDVPKANKYIHMFFGDKIGVYHTGVEVLNHEYSFGGHPHDYSGIFITPPKDIKTLSVSDTFKFKESQVIGHTFKTEEQIKEIAKEMGSEEFKGKNYHLIRKNCNYFSNAFCKRLCGKGIPEWVNRMVGLVEKFPAIEQHIPKEFVTPRALEKDVKQHEKQKKTKQTSEQTSAQTSSQTTAQTSPQSGTQTTSSPEPNTGTTEKTEESTEDSSD